MSGGIPKVTVILPVYNGEDFVAEAVRSILEQSFSDFELLVIDDGSTDNSLDIIRSFDDSRIRLHVNEHNLRLIATLNRGIGLAQGEYIARMDADDISCSDRLEKQLNYLDENTDVYVAGAQVRYIDASGAAIHDRLAPTYPLHPDVFRWRIWFGCCIAHPTVVARRKFFEIAGFYNKDYCHCEDYELWLRSAHSLPIINLPDVLYSTRIHGHNVSVVHHDQQRHNSNLAVASAMFRSYKLAVEPRHVALLQGMTTEISSQEIGKVDNKDVYSTIALLNNLYDAVAQTVGAEASLAQIKMDYTERLWRLGILGLRRRKVAGIKALLQALKVAPIHASALFGKKIWDKVRVPHSATL